ncbi:Stress responsive alpha-beta barrel [Trema orientale]|uniref:Stress responsive alpha-beta barrel n=1 Tax=Trema orientale TaxID=63057 RepID=A0A2P5F5P8_TREOI|nr:Stress responsive alpha-beta barrel [Trema orientale]
MPKADRAPAKPISPSSNRATDRRSKPMARRTPATAPIAGNGSDRHRGKDVSIENLHPGFTHIFVSTFESTEAHPAHVDFANLFVVNLDKVIVFDYKPTIYRS